MIGAGVIVLLAAVAPGAGDAPPVNFAVWAVQATKEGRTEPYFDRGIEEIRTAVADLPYDTYKNVHTSRSSATPSSPARIRINADYTLLLTPVGGDTDGRIRLDVVVEMDPQQPGGRPVKAIESRLAVTPGKLVKLTGLKLPPGELVILFKAQT